MYMYSTEQSTEAKGLCCGSVTFWYESGSGSADPYLWLTNPDNDPAPDPALDPVIFVRDLQDSNEKLFFLFFAYYF